MRLARGGATWPRTSPAFAEGASGVSGMDGKRWPPKGVSPHVDVGLRVGLELADLSFNDIRDSTPHNSEVKYLTKLKFRRVFSHKG